MFEIIPSPGTFDSEWPAIEKKIELARIFTRSIHIDVVDGKFAPTTTFADPLFFAKYTKDILFEVHLMVEEPITYLKPWAKAGFRRFFAQVERMTDQVEFVAQGQLLGEVGLALDTETSIDALTVPLADLDGILLMTVKAGLSGQSFLPEQLKKVRLLAQKTSVPITVDGGINETTLSLAKDAGACRFVMTSALFQTNSIPKELFEKYQDSLRITGV